MNKKFETSPLETSPSRARMTHVREHRNGSAWRTVARRCALVAAMATCTVLAAANALFMPVDAHAAPIMAAPALATGAADTPASGNYSKHSLRPRFVVPGAKVRAPHTRAADFQAPAAAAKSLALPSGSTGLTSLPAPNAADLAQTDDVVFTPAIQDLAASLDHNPVQIYNWVRDHIVFVPTYGSMQGADATLQTRRGNAFDTSSLLIALLRASNVPSRYAYGSIEIPAAAAQNWVGNVAVPEAAVALFAQGGIPVQAVVTGGSIGAIQIEHVWVEAYVDFDPSRGAINRSATTWVPLDAGYKQYRYTAGMPVRSAVAVDTASLAAQLTQGATQTPDSVAGLNVAALGSTYADFATRVASYINTQKPGASVADVLGAQSTIAEGMPVLAGTLPYKTLVFGSAYADLPDNLRWKVQYGVYASEFDRTQNKPIVTVTQSLPQLVGKRLTLSFAGASGSDNSNLAALLNSNPLPTSLSAASVQTAAQLTLDGQVVSSGGSVPFGTTLVGGVGIFEPQLGAWTYTASSRVVAGETHSIAAIGEGVAPAALGASRDRLAAMNTQLAARQYGGLSQDGLVGEVLNYAALAYATTIASTGDLNCKACGIVSYALPTIARINTHASVTYVNGVPQSVSFPGVALDVEMIGRTAAAADNNAAHALAYQRTFGEQASAYTHLLLDALFTDAVHTGRTASTVRALDAANIAKQKIFQITASNSASVIPQLSVDAGAVSAIQDAIGAGRTATISQTSVGIGNWNGVGYLLEDPVVGSGDYEITGRTEAELDVAGGWLPFALAGPALTVQGNAIAQSMQGIIGAEYSYYSAAIALLADYGSAAWANFVGANVVVTQWWLCALWDGLPGTLTDPGTTVVSTTSVDDFSNLPGAPAGNDPPHFTSTPVVNGAIGHAYQYFAMAVDPNGDTLSFSLVNGPSGLTMASGGLLSWTSPVTGSYPVTIRVSDGTSNVDQSFTLTIGAVLPLDLSLGIAPQFVNTGDQVTLTVATTGGSGPVTKTLTVDAAAVALDANGQAKITATTPGSHVVIATATDNKGTLTRTSAFGVNVAGDTAPPSVQITAPNDGDVLTAPTQVTGSVADANLLLWQLLASPTGIGQWKELARGTQPVNGALALFDPTQMANGQYDLNLVAYDANGQSSSSVIHVIVQGELKLGMFTVSFNDMQLDVGGVPLTITRTYDSRKKDIQGDFGYGWTLSYQNVTLQRNRPLGEQWETYQPGLITFCIRAIGKRVVSIALADGKVHQFDVVASPDCDIGQFPAVFSMAFNPRPGTTSMLESIDAADLLFQGGTVYDSSTGGAFDSMLYRLTTLENYQYILQSSDGANTFQVVQITDPNGEVLSLGKDGVVSSNGAALQFARDAQGRITQVTDPAGRTVKYGYTPAGDLDNITSPINQVSRNQYAVAPATLAHLLTSYTDASGTQQLRNEYDASGKLIAQYDALGNKVDFSARDLNNHTQAVADRNGNKTTYTFDDAGNITRILDAKGGTTSATFDAYANLLTQTDPLGRITSTTYDTQSGTVLSQTDALGNTASSEWNFYSQMGNHTPQNLKSITDELGHKTTFGYTNPGMLRAITDQLGHATTFGWSGANFDQLAQLTDATGNTTRYVNDDKGRKIQETDPLGNVTKYTYDSAGHLVTTTRTRVVNGQTQTLTSTNTVDADGKVLSTTDALGNVMQITWTAQKQMDTQTDALGRATKYSYDATGRPIKTTYPDGTSESTGYDANGNTTSQTDRAGHIIKTDYDALNRPTTITNPDGTSIATAYDAAGQVMSSTDELGRSVGYQYDAAGRKTQAADPAGNATGYAYDAAGKLTKVTDALNHSTQYVYDEGNRKTQTTWPDGSTNQYAYDAAGRKTKDIDPLSRSTQYAYDVDGRLNQVTDALGKISKYAYDELGDKIGQTDALNHLTQWAYDALGRATSHTLPDNRYETSAYDAVGRLTNRTDFAGNATGYSYDTADRVIEQVFVDGTVIGTTYTANGQVASLTRTANGVAKATKYTYDARNRLTDILNPDQSKLHYGYDAAGQRTRLILTTPDQQSQTIDYTYDAAGNLATVSTAGRTFTYKYDAANRKIERDDPNGVVTRYTYDANGRLSGYVAQKGSTILAKGDYTLNAAGQRTALAYVAPDGQTRNLSYAYDGAGKLTGETRSLPAHNTTWTLDAVGNRTMQVLDSATSNYAYDATDRLTSITGANAATYVWDQNGQLQSKTLGTAKTTYTFDAQHRLAGATLPDGSSVQYVYAADGNLSQRSKTSGTVVQTTNYLVDPNLAFAQVAAEYDTSGHASAIYVYGDELLMRFAGTTGTTYHHDGVGSVTVLTDDSGSAIQTYGYDAWGNLVESTGTDANPYLFAGERFDADVGLVYLRARWYEPGVGRFIAFDPQPARMGSPASLNRYVYANTDPVNMSDRRGLEADLAELEVDEGIVASGTVSAQITTFNTGLVAANDALWTTSVSSATPVAASAAIAVMLGTFAEVAYRTKRDRFIGKPTIVFGGNFPEHAMHILSAQTGFGNYSPKVEFGISTPFLNHIPRPDGAWYNDTVQCSKAARRADPGKACDEYPFYSTKQGGPKNYDEGSVSLKLLDNGESRRTGPFIQSFYNNAPIAEDGVSEESKFVALGLPWMPSFYTDRRGTVHPYQ